MATPKAVRQRLTQIQEKHGKSNEHLAGTLTKIEESVRYQAQGVKVPWIDDEGHTIWSAQRIKVAKFVFSQVFETIMGIIIVTNLVFIMFEVDHDATCYPDHIGKDYPSCPGRSESVVWLRVVNIALLVIYSLECVTRFYVERCRFFRNTWNMIDLVTVLLGWVSILFSGIFNLGLLRLSRLVRVLRAARVFISVPELYLLISGLYSSIKAIIFGSLMLFFVIVVWAVIAVEVFHPIATDVLTNFPSDCTRCKQSFQSVFDAGITLFQQIVAGDSWGVISIPVIEREPWTAPILFAIMMTVSLGVMNLILAVIVERAAEARSNDQERKLKKKEQDRATNMIELACLCATMDADGSGALSLEEMLAGYDDDVGEFRKLMQLMDIRRDDITSIFEVLDADSSGEVSYLEFCQHLGSFFERDPNVMHALVKYSILELRKLMRSEVVEALQQNTQMLWEQQKMLWEQRRLMESLRREAGGQPPKEADAWGFEPFRATAKASASPLFEANARQLPEPLVNFQSVQDELQMLLAKAADISMAALPDPPKSFSPKSMDVSGGSEREQRRTRAPRARESRRSMRLRSRSLSSQSRDEPEISPGARRLTPEEQKFEDERALLCESFHDRLREAERLQEQLRQILGSLKATPSPAAPLPAEIPDAGDGKSVSSERV